ncbi:isocitrate lyase/PEP mutase family protein [Sphingobium chungbukense]|uniref:Carboxyvinyl-carboxyphosphonate phosphorylmutase n=1 Tax=Sphingobium chungbukense TaxID=56193 RepID=A0A0M3AT02_9SPHN|nr:isocitrate lyase/PEP mutase family protein [Sphingobium chungbukense]KKW93018.1 carboxyvinyl-carboxyphosphonate phosphorylmutase [Sphingobium chungbukense]
MTLREIASRRKAVLAPGAANALFARIIEDLGFECVYVTGAGIANMALGAPDIGLTTLDDIAGTVSRMADAVSLPLIVDADTGFGNAVNTFRTMKVLERAGASAIQLEDQDFPKRCGHFNGKGVIPLGEMLPKIRAAVDARTRDTLIIARTDALAVAGIDVALERAEAFVEAGADITFVEAPRDAEQMRRIATLSVPQVANIVHGGKTPPLPQSELADMGFGLVLYANAALQAAVRASATVLGSLKATGSLDAVHDQLASFEERQAAVAKHHWDALEQRFKPE